MAAEKFSFVIAEMNHIFLNIKIRNSYSCYKVVIMLHNITVLLFYQIKAALVSIRDLFQKCILTINLTDTKML